MLMCSDTCIMCVAQIGASASKRSKATNWLVEHLFQSSELIPVRRPHGNDEVVANLAKHRSSELSKDYLADADLLRLTTLQGLQPSHRCEHPSGHKGVPRVVPNLHGECERLVQWDGMCGTHT